MAWKDQHPNWLAKARALGWDQSVIQKIRQGGTPGPRKLEQYRQVNMRNGQAVVGPRSPPIRFGATSGFRLAPRLPLRRLV